ncbi:hypothetical protein B0H14DRAFT_3520194 [Mycena olivaceomarginata]|nr:hypothetical protein B0H14DRAFT_3520194 [Mycena olivaceomarginata]
MPLRLLDTIIALAAHSSPSLDHPARPPPAPGYGGESWFVNPPALRIRVSASETPAQHPIYWAPTFDDAVKYLPRCRGFETAFGFGTGRS